MAAAWKGLNGLQDLLAKVTANLNGQDSSISVEGVGSIAFDTIKNPVTGKEAFPRVVLPQLLSNELEQFTTKGFAFESGHEGFVPRQDRTGSQDRLVRLT